MTFTFSFPSSAIRLSFGATLLGAAMSAAAVDTLDEIRQQGRLKVGVHHVMPEYVAGTKFRTPESIDTALAEDLAKRLRVKHSPVRIDTLSGMQMFVNGKVDIMLAAVPDHDRMRHSAVMIPTGYASGPMAIMRTDTTIKSWEQLKGRSVCVTEGSLYAGTLAGRYGAIEQAYKAPADALLALRIGKCDAAVHNNVLLEELIKLPEWKKFSARLPVGPRVPLFLVAPTGNPKLESYLRRVAQEWQSKTYLPQLINKAARSIAFEVYLDQDVPDCH